MASGVETILAPKPQKAADAAAPRASGAVAGVVTTALRIPAQPTIFHVTHWKAGSQWIHKILIDCAPELIVRPEAFLAQIRDRPLVPGKVYPTVYATREEFYSVRLPPWWARFVVIRDLRDTLVSGYFSLMCSHAVHHDVGDWRRLLGPLTVADGLIRLMTDGWLDRSARIQQSWFQAGERLIRYEELLADDVAILSEVLLGKCRLPVSGERFRKAVLANRFERLTAGRPRGREDIFAHERKGVAGDWQTYFDTRIKRVFKERYGRLLIATGYERDLNW
jgi:lipopolysaccharide transport system ATP-binding protein